MGKTLNNLLAKPIYPYLYGVCFLLFKSSAFFKSFNVEYAILLILGYSFCCFLLINFFKLFTNPAYAAFPVLILFGSLFHVVGVAILLQFQYAYIPHNYYYSFYAIIVILIILILPLLKNIPTKYATNFNQIVNVFLICATAVFCITGFRATIRDLKEEDREHYNATKIQVTKKLQRDIVWILMDEYGSSSSLKKQMNFQNPLDSSLEKRGFQILKNTRSRFNKTLFSINSIFNLDDSILPNSYYQGFELLKESALVPIMEKLGYRFINLGFFDFNKHTMLADRSGYMHSYLQQVSSGTLFGIIYASRKYSLEKIDDYNQTVFKKLDDSLSNHSNQPSFIWAHVTIPHEPFCRDAKGNLQKEIFYSGTDSNLIKTNYLNYLLYGNSRLLQLIDLHPDYKEKIIIISGDHGPRYPYLKDKNLQYSPFVAIHFPDKLDSTTINKFQFISQLPNYILSFNNKKKP